MITFRRRIGGKVVEIPLFTLEEAKLKGLDPIKWREAFGRVQKGDWILSDDGFCAEVIDVRATYIRCTAAWLSKAVIKQPVGSEGCFCALSRIKHRSYDFFLDRPVRKRILSRKRVQEALRFVAVHDLTGRKADLEFAGRIAFPRDNKPLWGMRRIMAWKETQEMIKNIAKEILTANGISNEFVMGIYKDALDVAREKKDPANMLKVADTLAEYLELKPKKAAQLPPWAGEGGDLTPPDSEMLRMVEEAKAALKPADVSDLDVDTGKDYTRVDEPGDDYVKPEEYVEKLARSQSR